MEFPAEIETLTAMLKFIINGAKDAGLSATSLGKLELASEETLVNVIHHAYHDKSGSIRIAFETIDKTFYLHIYDQGKAFNPVEKKIDVQKNTPIKQRKVGGLGIFLVRQLIDEISYRRQGDENHLTLAIRFP